MKSKQMKNILFWCLGIVLCTLGISLCTKGNLGLSMIAAPPYILHLWLRDSFSWFTQGTAEYVWQAVLLVITCLIIRRFRFRYLLSFVTALISGFVIDGWLTILGGNGAYAGMPARIAAFAAGTIITAAAIAMFFRTTLPLQVYELVVTEIAERYRINKDKVKQWNDIVMLVISLAFALILTGGFNGVGVGTIIITLVNATLIRLFGKLLDRIVS
ncbi:MAG: DUF6198 family protein [Lachnospiraceae bacterium]|nr:DUF6198 family protein [Lachnospiraceae bacterium]